MKIWQEGERDRALGQARLDKAREALEMLMKEYEKPTGAGVLRERQQDYGRRINAITGAGINFYQRIDIAEEAAELFDSGEDVKRCVAESILTALEWAENFQDEVRIEELYYHD